MAIALGLDPAWVTGTSATISSAAFSPAAGSLIIVISQIDAAPAPTISDSVGLTWTAIGTPQGASSGGRVAAWWAYTATGRTNMTVSVDWGTVVNKAIKVVTWTGTASAAAVVSKMQSTSTANPLNLNVSTSNDGCRIEGTALDWNARGGPTSSDDELSYTLTNGISGTSAHKSANSVGVGTSVTLNIVKGTVSGAAADWGYKVWEIVPDAVSTTPVTSDLDLRWDVITPVISDLDLRWRVLTQVTTDLDLRWVSSSSLTQVTSDLNLQWSTYTRMSSDLDLRWAGLTKVNSDLDLRWSTLLPVADDLDLRWISVMPDEMPVFEYWGMKI